MTPRRAWLYWLLPPLFSLWVYWSALRGWFLQDDFVWLGLLRQVHSLPDLWHAVFHPTVQGTLRPWSDRVFFLVFRALFDLDALPYHAWIFFTQMAAAVLMMSVVRRVSGSRVAGFAAPLFWTGNAVLVMTMAWACLYKDVLCSFTLLLAFHFLLRYLETGRERYNLYQWIAFLLGFGVMETDMMYPAIAIVYVFLFARPYLRKAALLAIPSVVYLALNVLFIRKQASGPYAMHLDGRLPVTFLRYWVVAWKPDARLLEYDWSKLAVAAALSVCALVFIAARWRRNDRLPAFFLFWFLVTLAPVLPLRDQFQTYYLSVPSVGLAMLAGCAVGAAWRSGQLAWRAAAAVLALVFLVPSVYLARREARSWRARGLRAEAVVRGVMRARELHPDQAIVLDDVDDWLFWDTMPDHSFAAAGVSDVYLSPESAARIRRLPFRPSPDEFALSTAAMQAPERIEVYDAGGAVLRNVSRAYFNRPPPAASLPVRVELGSAASEGLLGGTWYQPEGDFRWMGKQASVRLRGPAAAGQRLYLTGACPAALLAAGPLTVQISVDGVVLRRVALREGTVEEAFPLPAQFAGKAAVEVRLEISRTLRSPGDNRDLGLPVSAVEIR